MLLVVWLSGLQIVMVCGSSMEPTYHNGQILHITRATEPQVGTVGVFNGPNGVIVKRVAYVAGDVIRIKEGSWLVFPKGIKGAKLNPIFGKTVNYTIPQGYVYVLGDNALNSEDSRYIGPIKWATCKGVVR